MRDIIKRIKEVQILLGHTLQPAVQWATQPYNPYYPYNGGQSLYGQAPQNPPFQPQQGTALAQPSVPPNTTSQPKLNFMAGKSVSFAPEVETVHGVKEVIKDVISGVRNNFTDEISELKNALVSNQRQLGDSFRDFKTDVKDYLYNQSKDIDQSFDRLHQVKEFKDYRKKDRSRDFGRDSGRTRDRNFERSFRDESRTPSRDRYNSRSPSKSPGRDRNISWDRNRNDDWDRNRNTLDKRKGWDKRRDWNKDRDRRDRRDRSPSIERSGRNRPRSGSGTRYKDMTCYWCGTKGHTFRSCQQLEEYVILKGRQKRSRSSQFIHSCKAFYLDRRNIVSDVGPT